MADRVLMMAQWKRLSAERVSSGAWNDADVRETYASIKSAVDSGDAVREEAAAMYLAAEMAEIEMRDQMVRDAVARMRAERIGDE